jgi:hypothetical protein
MRIIILPLTLIFFISASIQCSHEKNELRPDHIYIASWNVENLFDTLDQTDKNDEWFTPSSEINWTQDKLEAKLANLAKVIEDMNSGNGPDILGLQEIENLYVLKLLTENISLDRDYKIIHFDSPDNRGIDNAIIYDARLFELLKSENLKVEPVSYTHLTLPTTPYV